MSDKGRWIVVERATTVMALAAMSAVLVSQFYRPGRATRPAPSVPKQPISLSEAATIGNADAPKVLIIYSDFQCPFCGQFGRDTWPRVREAFVDTGQVLVAFRNLPLPIHAFAERAAEAAECARREGKFWEMHDRLFADQAHLDDASLSKDALGLGLDPVAWRSCSSGAAQAHVQADVAQARSFGITGTPFFLLGTRQADGSVKATRAMIGSSSFETIKSALDGVPRH